MKLFGSNGNTVSEDEDDDTPRLPPIRTFSVQLQEKDDKGKHLSVTLQAHSYDFPNGALAFAEYIDVGEGKAQIVMSDCFAPGVWKRFRETPGAAVPASKSVN